MTDKLQLVLLFLALFIFGGCLPFIAYYTIKKLQTMRIITIIALAFLLTACGTVQKSQSLVTTENDQERVTTVRTITSREIAEVQPAVTKTAKLEAQELLRGVPIIIDSERQKVEVVYDASTGDVTATATAKEVATPVIETTVQEQIVEERESEKDTTEKVDKKTTFGFSTGQAYLMIFAFILLMVVIMMVLRKL